MSPLDFVAGSCGGAVGIFAGYPFDTVKVLIQNQTLPIKYTSTFQTIFKVIQEDGIKRLYRGLATPLVTVAFNNAVTFGAYGHAMEFLPPSKYKDLLGGIYAGTMRAIFISPVEVVKIQMQVTDTSGYRPTVFKCIGDIYANHGLKGFTRGYLTCFMREPLAFAAYFSSFELMTKDRKNDLLVVFMAGGISGIISWVPTYPFDVIKTRIQGDDLKNPKYKGTLHCLKCTLVDTSPKILYRGFGSCIYRAFVVNSGVLFVYTQIKNMFG